MNMIQRSLRLRNSSSSRIIGRYRDRRGDSSLFFSSSSSRRKRDNQKRREPHLTKRNKRDIFILTTGICYVFGYYITSNDWDEDVMILKNKLISQEEVSSSSSSSSTTTTNSNSKLIRAVPEIIQESFDSNNNNAQVLPSCVHRYLEKVSSSSSTLPSSSSSSSCVAATAAATVTQSGEFLALANQWYPFTSDLFITAPPPSVVVLPLAALSSNNNAKNGNGNVNVNINNSNSSSCNTLGFVWDAKTTIFKLSHRILESYYYNYNSSTSIQAGNDDDEGGDIGVGTIITKLWGIFPFVLQLEEDDPYILSWLAMIIPLYPKNVLLNNKLLIWNNKNKSNNLHDHDSDSEFSLPSSSSLSSSSSSSSSCIAKAELCCNDDNDKTNNTNTSDLEFIFDNDTDLLTSIKVTERRNLTNESSKQQTQQQQQPYWQVFYKDYKQVPVSSKEERQRQGQISTSLLIPTTIEIGRGAGCGDNAYDDNNNDSSSFRSHFKIHNHRIKYLPLK